MIFGIGAEIKDQHGWIWTLTQAADGTRDLAGIVAEVRAGHPQVAAEDIRSALEALLSSGFLEDAAASPDDTFSVREQERYGRGVSLLRWMDRAPHLHAWELQERLRAARVLLIGVGGTGGVAAQALVASGVGRLHCVDPDEVTLSNLNRQPLFREEDVGRPKVAVALASLRALNSEVTVTGDRQRIDGPGGLTALLGEGPPGAYDLLVLAADQPPDIRRWANRACLAADVAWADGGYRGPLVSVGVHVPGRGGCWECHYASESDRRDLRLAPGQDADVASPRMPWNPVNAVTAGLSGSLLAHAALALLTGAPPMEPGFRLGVNLMVPGDPVAERFPRRPDCDACGEPGPA